MKIVFSPKFFIVYTNDPAAAPGRLEAIVEELKEYEFVEPSSANEEDVLLVHTLEHVKEVKAEGLYEIATLSVGAAIKAAKIGLVEPAFAVLRPPGHHASQGHSWGFCYFNNVAIAIRRLQKDGDIVKAVIVDFDLHYGDGTANIFSMDRNVRYFHMPGGNISSIADFLEKVEYDVIAVSAGFDKHKDDWGGILETEDYKEIGKIIKEYSERCNEKRFAVLEGGYNHKVLGKNVKAFIKGFE